MSDDTKTLKERFFKLTTKSQFFKKRTVVICIVVLALVFILNCFMFSVFRTNSIVQEEIETDVKTSQTYNFKYEHSTENNTENYIAPVIDIKYPQFDDLSKEQNRMIKDAAYEILDYWEHDGLTMDIDYEVKLKNEDILSVVFFGYANVYTAAHPVYPCYSFNLDLKNNRKLVLSNFITVDDDFINSIKNKNFSFEMTNGEESETLYVNELLPFDRLVNSDKKGDIYSYVTQNKIGIIFPVSHAIGDYKIIEVDLGTNVEERTVSDISLQITSNSKTITLSNNPFYYSGDVFVPLEEMLEKLELEYSVAYNGNKIKVTFIESIPKEYEMEIGKKKLTGFELGNIGEMLNAPVKANNIVYVPIEYFKQMWFANVVIDYSIVSDNVFAKKINQAKAFEYEAIHDPNSNQGYMNEKSYEVFKNWDELLSEIMAELPEEDLIEIDYLIWSKSRDDYGARQSSPYEGGSMEPMILNYAKARMTRKFCEQLLVEYILN